VKTEEDHWFYRGEEEPFINELCLVLLVAIRHEIERELTFFAVRKNSKGRTLSDDDYRDLVKEERGRLRGEKKKKKKSWKDLYYPALRQRRPGLSPRNPSLNGA
jgi:hypothetical protein